MSRKTGQRTGYARVGLLASMLAGGPLATAQAARFNWQGNDGDWAVPANWFNDTLNVTATAPPGADDSASIFGQSSLVHYDLDGTGAALRAVTLYAHGTLLVEGGTLETGDIALGQKTANLPGWLTQSAGAVNVSGTLSVSGKANGNINDASLYRLEAGLLQTGSTELGLLTSDTTSSSPSAPGRFIHEGGQHVTSTLTLQRNSTYQLADGSLDADTLHLQGTGPSMSTFTLSGGDAQIGLLRLSSYGRFEWTAGDLTLDNYANASTGAFVLPVGPSQLSFSGIVDLSTGTIHNTANASWTLGPQSLLILPPTGPDPRDAFASFVTGGLVHYRGQTLTIAADRTVTGAGLLVDPVDIAGTVTAQGALTLRGGGVVRSTAHLQGVDLLVLNSTQWLIEGGQVQGSVLSLGGSSTNPNNPTTVTVEGGDLSFDQVSLGGFGGMWMTGGSLVTQQILVGVSFGVQGVGPPPRTQLDVADATVFADWLRIGRAGVSPIQMAMEAWVTLGDHAQLHAGSLDLGETPLLPTGVSPASRLHVAGAGSRIDVDHAWRIHDKSSFTADAAALVVLHGAALVNRATDAADFTGFDRTTLTAAAATDASLEAAGQDLGATLAGFTLNFSLASILLEAGSTITLTDSFDNQPDWAGVEAVYVDTLTLEAGSTLTLGGINLYTRVLTSLGAIDDSGGGALTVLPLLMGDANHDGLVNATDFLAVEINIGAATTGHGLLAGDANADGRVDGDDWLTVERHFGATLAGQSIPEPAAAAVLSLGLWTLAGRRRP